MAPFTVRYFKLILMRKSIKALMFQFFVSTFDFQISVIMPQPTNEACFYVYQNKVFFRIVDHYLTLISYFSHDAVMECTPAYKYSFEESRGPNYTSNLKTYVRVMSHLYLVCKMPSVEAWMGFNRSWVSQQLSLDTTYLKASYFTPNCQFSIVRIYLYPPQSTSDNDWHSFLWVVKIRPRVPLPLSLSHQTLNR